MICIKCGHANPDSLNFCEKCNAKIFKMATGQASTSAIDVEEGQEYATPQRSYVTEYLYNLSVLAYEYVNSEGPGEPLLEAYEIVKAKLDELEGGALPDMLERLQAERIEDPADEFPRQSIYLLTKGVSMYRDGCGLMDRFIESGENATLVEAVTKMQEGNNNLGLALEMGQAREQMIQEELNRREQAERAPGGAAAPSSSGAAEGRVRSGGD